MKTEQRESAILLSNYLIESMRKLIEISTVGGIAGYNAPLMIDVNRRSMFNKMFKARNKLNKVMTGGVNRKDVEKTVGNLDGREYTGRVAPSLSMKKRKKK